MAASQERDFLKERRLGEGERKNVICAHFWQAADSQNKLAEPKDISLTGMSILLPNKPEIGSILKLSLYLVKEEPSISVRAKVCWVKNPPSASSEGYLAGLEFINLGPQAGQRLEEFLKAKKA